MNSLSLESDFYSFHLRPDEGAWDLSAAGGGRIEHARLGARLRTHRGEMDWVGGLSGAEAFDRGKEPSGHGAVRYAGLRLSRDGLEVVAEFEACLERPLFLWRLSMKNVSDQEIMLDSLEMLQVGPAACGGAASRRAAEGEGTPGTLRLHADPGDISFFTNGFQSWSFAGALGPDQHMPRTRLGPILWPENPATPVSRRRGEFVAHMFGVAVDRAHRTGMLFGFLSQRATYGTLSVRLDRPALSLRMWAQGDGVVILPGQSLTTDWACIQSVDLDGPDPLAAYMDAVAAENGVGAGVVSPVGWCSWYKYMKAVSQQDVEMNLACAAGLRDQIPLSVFQLDDGYQAAQAEFLETNDRFPGGLKPLAGRISDEGFVPGLWMAPFITAPKSALSRHHPGWILQGPRGGPANAGSTWAVLSRGLDVTHPEVMEHTRQLIRTAVHDCGFRYLKLDFLYAGVLEGRRHDPTRTRAQALDAILHLIRDEAAPEATLVGCGCPMGSGIGVFDAMRIGTDVAPTWHPRYFGTELFFRPEPTFPSVRNVLRNVLARMPLHNRWWVNDPDCILVRQEDTRLTPAEVQSLATVISMSGGSLIVSDDLTVLSAERIEWLGRLLPTLEGRAQVLDALETSEPSEIVLKQSGAAGEWTLVARLNWDDKPRALPLDLVHFGLRASPKYLWADPWERCAGLAIGPMLYLPPIPAHGVRFVAVRPATGQPAWMGDTLHISQGQAVKAWRVEGSELHAKLSIGRPRRGEAWVWLPGAPQQVALDGKPVLARAQGYGVFALEIATQKESELTIRW
ncbi:MAG: alpha-galactosidase [Chloroflexi bacterium]|nr:alpha-galactosidase [Chloroflexota bacterium]